MKKRPLGKTGISVGEIGLGAWQLGSGAWGHIDEDVAINIVHRALDLGTNLLDTAPGYGGGQSEIVLGKALKGKRDTTVICSKFGHTPEGETNFDVAQIRPMIEGSLRRLQTDFLDVVLIHNPPSELLDGNKAPHYEEFERLKAEGKIQAYGASIDSAADMEILMRTTKSEAMEVLFNVFHQGTGAAFAEAHKAGIGLIAKVPLDSGWLSGKYTADSAFDGVRSRWTNADIARRAFLVGEMRSLLPAAITVQQAALGYILSYPEISTIIPGAMSVHQVEANSNTAAMKLDQETVAGLRKLWEEQIAPDPLPW